METIYKPERQANESFSDYKARRKAMNQKLKSHKRGRMVWVATDSNLLKRTGTTRAKGTFVGNVMRDLE